MYRLTLIITTFLLLVSCGGNARKAEKEAQKARTEHRQSVVTDLKAKAAEARTLFVTYRAFGFTRIKEGDIVTDSKLDELLKADTDERFEGLSGVENDQLDLYIRVMTEDIENTRTGHEMIRQELDRMGK